jgi:acyl carrier protein
VTSVEALQRELRQFVIDNFLFGEGEFANDESFLESGIIDSTGVLELVSFLEQRYEINVENYELIPSNLDSIDGLTGFVTAKAAARQPVGDNAGQ